MGTGDQGDAQPQLEAQVVEGTCQPGVVGQLEHQAMKGQVLLDLEPLVITGGDLAQTTDLPMQTLLGIRVEARHHSLEGVAFQTDAQIEDIAQLGHIQGTHEEPAPRSRYQQATALHQPGGLAYRGPADAELRRQPRLRQPLARCEARGQDRLGQVVDHLVHQVALNHEGRG